MQQTIDQLRANAKGHKKTVDKLAAKVSQLTQELTEANQHIAKLESQPANSVEQEKKTKLSTLALASAACLIFGFLATVCGICAYGWFMALGRLL